MPQSLFHIKARELGCHILVLFGRWLRAPPGKVNAKASLWAKRLQQPAAETTAQHEIAPGESPEGGGGKDSPRTLPTAHLLQLNSLYLHMRQLGVPGDICGSSRGLFPTQRSNKKAFPKQLEYSK